MRLVNVLAWPAVLAVFAPGAAAAQEDAWAPKTDYLHGSWDILPGHADEQMFAPDVAAKTAGWGKVPVPGLWPQATGLPPDFDGAKWKDTDFVWYRYRFDVPAESKWRRTVLRRNT